MFCIVFSIQSLKRQYNELMLTRSETYTIRQVIDLTGVTEFLLRTWENRYSAIKPKRTKTGRRVYTSQDLLRTHALVELTKRGNRVGRIAHLPLSTLQEMLEQEGLSKTRSKNKTVLEVMNHIQQSQWESAHGFFLKALKKQSPHDFIFFFLLPLLSEIGLQVSSGELSIAQEHILTAFIKESLGLIKIKKRPNTHTARIVLAAPEGDYHDIGLLIASCLLRQVGVETLYLGANMPKKDLASTCLLFRATHLLISTTADNTKESFFNYIHFLNTNLSPSIVFWIAGSHSQKQNLSLQRPYKVFNDFESFNGELLNV